MNRILFPISVDSDNFSTDIVLDGLTQLTPKFNHIVFLIADSLQIYNKAKQIISGKPFDKILNEFRSRNKYFEERIIWLDKLAVQLKIDKHNKNWEYMKAETLFDKYFFRIYKLLIINFHTDNNFKSDIEIAAVNQIKKHKKEFDERELKLNTLYILEEIALNLRVRLWNQLDLEYYIGEFHSPLIELYFGKYNLSISDICNKSTNTNFRFYMGEIIDNQRVKWKEMEKYAR